jgi:hypothetical protein
MVRILVDNIITRARLCWWTGIRRHRRIRFQGGATVVGAMGSETLILRARASCTGGEPVPGERDRVARPSAGSGNVCPVDDGA